MQLHHCIVLLYRYYAVLSWSIRPETKKKHKSANDAGKNGTRQRYNNDEAWIRKKSAVSSEQEYIPMFCAV